MAKNKFKSGLVIFIILIAIGVITGIVSVVKSSGTLDSSKISVTFNSNSSSKSKGNSVCAILISGIIQDANNTYNQEWILNVVDKAKRNPRNKAIALFINTPGGAVYHADELYLALQDYKTTGKKIYAYFGPMAASGGYYIACAADKIYANRNTLTGSIGVTMGQFYDFSEAMEKLGIKSVAIHSGRNKTMGTFTKPLTEEQKNIMQALSDEAYEQFCSIVSTQRHLKIERVHELADGRIYSAKQALENGLVDKVDSWENMINDLGMELDDPDINVIMNKYEKKQGFVNMMMGSASEYFEMEAAAKTGLPKKLIEEINRENLYPAYLYE